MKGKANLEEKMRVGRQKQMGMMTMNAYVAAACN